MKFILVGIGGQEHVGAHLRRAADDMQLVCSFHDCAGAYSGSKLENKFNWWIRGRRPSRLHVFSESLVKHAAQMRPECVLTTGLAPLSARCLEELGRLGIRRLNYLTDDPWNPAHYAPWFVEALPRYDCVFSTRTANLDDLRGSGVPDVRYLPFGFSRHQHYPEPAVETSVQLSSDVVFAGGADPDRVPVISALIRNGFKVALYGGYWDRYKETRTHTRGIADPGTLRQAMATAKIALCLVRKANRDGQAMRTFEVAAMKCCMLVEKTTEHMQLFGPDGEVVHYFESIPEMCAKVQQMLESPEERHRLADAAHRLIMNGGHSYHDRLRAMLAPIPVGATA